MYSLVHETGSGLNWKNTQQRVISDTLPCFDATRFASLRGIYGAIVRLHWTRKWWLIIPRIVDKICVNLIEVNCILAHIACSIYCWQWFPKTTQVVRMGFEEYRHHPCRRCIGAFLRATVQRVPNKAWNFSHFRITTIQMRPCRQQWR